MELVRARVRLDGSLGRRHGKKCEELCAVEDVEYVGRFWW